MREVVFAATRRYVELARANGLTPSQMALAWCYSRWFIASTIIGATDLTQLKENIDAISISLNDELMQEIDMIHADVGNPGQ